MVLQNPGVINHKAVLGVKEGFVRNESRLRQDYESKRANHAACASTCQAPQPMKMICFSKVKISIRCC